MSIRGLRLPAAAVLTVALVAIIEADPRVAAAQRPVAGTPAAIPAAPRPASDDEAHAIRIVSKPCAVSFSDTPLADALRYLSEHFELPIRLDEADLATAKVPADAAVTIDV